MSSKTEKSGARRWRALRSTTSNYLGKLIALGTGFILTPFMLHELGADSYGLWILVGSLVAYGALLDFGIASAITKHVASYSTTGQVEEAQQFISTALILYMLLGASAIMLAVIIAPFFPQFFNVPASQTVEASWLVVLSGVAVGIAIPATTTSAILRGLHRFDLTNVLSILGTLLYVVTTILILKLGGGLILLVSAGIVITVVMQIPSIYFVHRVAPELRLDWRAANRHHARRITSYSSSIFIVNFSGQLQAKTDELVIGRWLPLAAIAPYSVAHRLSEITQLLADQFLKIILPLASQLHAENDAASLRALYIVSTRLTLAVIVSIGAILMLIAPFILTLWVGSEYAKAAPLVWVLIIAVAVDTSQWSAASVLQGMARHRPLAFMALASGLANLVLSIILVQWIGLIGVALGTLIPTSIECIGFVMPYAMRVIGVRAREAITEIILPAFIPVVPTILALALMLGVIPPVSWLALGAVVILAALVYVMGYMIIGAKEFEQQVLHELVGSTIHFAKARLKPS